MSRITYQIPNKPQNLFFLQATAVFTALSLCSCEKPKEIEKPTKETDSALQKYDTNDDGALSETERNTMNSEFVEHFDSDGDGKLNAAERSEIRSTSSVKVSVTQTSQMTLAQAESFIRRMDKDNDGALSSLEVDPTRWKVIQKADVNSDQVITAQEWLQSRAQ